MKLQFDKRPGPARLKRIVHCFNWRQYSLLIIAIVFLAMSASASCGPSMEYKVGIAQFGTHVALDRCLQGFIDQMYEGGVDVS